MQRQFLHIPLTQLKPSKSNMRKTDRHADIDQLAASIEANGLLENLIVHPLGTADAPDAASYEVCAGGRRLEALKQLAKTKKIDRKYLVPCLVVPAGQDLTEISLAENFERVPPHPADQFEAFAKLINDGKTAADVSARFGISETFVLQRLKLAQVSPRLLAQYREGAMTLEQLMAFTISADHKQQEQLWFDSPYEDMPAHFIRRQLTSAQVDAGDPRAVFVGVQAYEAAGGIILRDLFDQTHEGYYQDSQLLDRLVAEKLEGVAANIRAQGWSWVEVRPQADFSHLAQFGRIGPTEVALAPEEEEQLSKLGERYDELVSLLEEQEDAAASDELDRLEGQINDLNAKKEVWPDEGKARSGVVVALDRDGEVSLTLGLVRLQLSRSEQDSAAASPKAKAPRSGYPESVLLDLSAHRTAALRATLAQQPANALIVLLHACVRQIFFGRRLPYIEIALNEASLDRASQTVGASKAAQLLSERHAYWSERVGKTDDVWAWLQSLDDGEKLSLLAYCVGVSVNVLRGSGDASPKYDDDADLAQLSGLDMTQWWTPTEAFLVRLSKADIIEAVKEGAAPGSARSLGDLKRGELARKAEALLADRGWLPKTWRPSPETAIAAE